MFKKIFDFIREYVIIEIAGKNKERFLNMLMYKGIEIKDCVPSHSKMILSIPRDEFKNIRGAVRKSGVKVKIIKKQGIREYIKSRRNRFGFLVCGLIIIVLGVISSRYIWCVEIDGIKRADKEEVTEILSKNGVYVGAKKSKINDLAEIKDDIVATDDINWAWLYMEGTKARLQVQETTPKPEIVDKNTPTDIIALCDGYLREATVRYGERRAVAGTTVGKGDILISGKVPVFVEGTEERYSYVNADGRFFADTIRRETGEFSKKETLRVKTGNKKTRFALHIMGKEYSQNVHGLYETQDIDEEVFDLTLPLLGYTGLSFKKCTVYEINEFTNILTEDEVLKRAEETLEERVMKGVMAEAKRYNETITYTKSGDTYTVTLTMYLRENIGIEIPRER